MQARPEAVRRIAVCIDDFGLYPGVASAAVDLARQGRISAVSCQTGAPAWAGGAPALRELMERGVDAGLHLDLTQHPVDTALRAPLGQWLVRTWTGTVPRARLLREIETQLDRFEGVAGRPPAHVDGHQHVHQLPIVRELLTETLAARYPGRHPWVRSTRSAEPHGFGKATLIERLGCGGLERLAREKGFRQNRHMLGVYDFSGDAARYLALLAGWLARAVSGDLLLCHPAAEGSPEDAIGRARTTEYEVLRGAEFGALVAASQVQIVPACEAIP